jgi:hypothetical protein
MDFIERLFGISPDHGTGFLEMLFFLACILAVIVWRWRPAQTSR